MSGQKKAALSGDVQNITAVSAYNLKFDYTNLKVSDFETEEAYLAVRMEKGDRIKEGRGETFRQDWFSYREELMEPKFTESFNRWFKNSEVRAQKNDTTAQYTMLVKTTWLYPGYMGQPAKLNAIISVFETSAPEKTLYSIQFERIFGKASGGNGLNVGVRLAGAYKELAKEMAFEIIKNK